MNKSSAAYVILFTVGICLVFGTGISVLHQATQDALARNSKLQKNRVLCESFVLRVEGKSAEAYSESVKRNLVEEEWPTGGRTAYRIREGSNDRIGFEFSGQGFWDGIRGIVVLQGDLSRITGLRILEQKETPGLGGRIEEDSFLRQFEGIAPDWQAPPMERLVLNKGASGRNGNRVDGITGATQTSVALIRMLNLALDSVGSPKPAPKEEADG